MPRFRALLPANSLLAMPGTTLRAYPHQLAYFNEIAGAPTHSACHLPRSRTDRGQDIPLVREWIDTEAEVSPNRTALSGRSGRVHPLTLPCQESRL